jgi:probable rRNA maturation factor
MIKININIKNPFEFKTSFRLKKDWFKDTAKKAFNLLKKAGNYEFEINVVSPEQMRKLNGDFRNKDESTTILSFVSSETKDKFIEAPSKYKYLGEIFICPEEIEKQAKEIKISTKIQVTRIFVHGILHLLEYGHDTDQRAREMEEKERKILRALNGK